jgi:hypothetical protein
MINIDKITKEEFEQMKGIRLAKELQKINESLKECGSKFNAIESVVFFNQLEELLQTINANFVNINQIRLQIKEHDFWIDLKNKLNEIENKGDKSQ